MEVASLIFGILSVALGAAAIYIAIKIDRKTTELIKSESAKEDKEKCKFIAGKLISLLKLERKVFGKDFEECISTEEKCFFQSSMLFNRLCNCSLLYKASGEMGEGSKILENHVEILKACEELESISFRCKNYFEDETWCFIDSYKGLLYSLYIFQIVRNNFTNYLKEEQKEIFELNEAKKVQNQRGGRYLIENIPLFDENGIPNKECEKIINDSKILDEYEKVKENFLKSISILEKIKDNYL